RRFLHAPDRRDAESLQSLARALRSGRGLYGIGADAPRWTEPAALGRLGNAGLGAPFRRARATRAHRAAFRRGSGGDLDHRRFPKWIDRSGDTNRDRVIEEGLRKRHQANAPRRCRTGVTLMSHQCGEGGVMGTREVMDKEATRAWESLMNDV